MDAGRISVAMGVMRKMRSALPRIVFIFTQKVESTMLVARKWSMPKWMAMSRWTIVLIPVIMSAQKRVFSALCMFFFLASRLGYFWNRRDVLIPEMSMKRIADSRPS